MGTTGRIHPLYDDAETVVLPGHDPYEPFITPFFVEPTYNHCPAVARCPQLPLQMAIRDGRTVTGTLTRPMPRVTSIASVRDAARLLATQERVARATVSLGRSEIAVRALQMPNTERIHGNSGVSLRRNVLAISRNCSVLPMSCGSKPNFRKRT